MIKHEIEATIAAIHDAIYKTITIAQEIKTIHINEFFISKL